ncbi:MAG: hypothetical protein AB7O04_03225 [Hyphomonadaceae bacterium]
MNLPGPPLPAWLRRALKAELARDARLIKRLFFLFAFVRFRFPPRLRRTLLPRACPPGFRASMHAPHARAFRRLTRACFNGLATGSVEARLEKLSRFLDTAEAQIARLLRRMALGLRGSGLSPVRPAPLGAPGLVWPAPVLAADTS